MKKYFLIFCAVLVSAIAVIVALPFMRDRASEQQADEQPEVTTTTSARTFETEDLYEAGPDIATQTVAFTQTTTVQVNALRDLPTDGNVLKVHTACIDDSTGIAYAAGIMTSDIAVIENGKTTSYLHTDLGGEGLALKYLYCGGGNVIMANERNIVSVDPTTGEARGEVTTSTSTVTEIAFFDDLHNIFAITTPKA